VISGVTDGRAMVRTVPLVLLTII